MNNEELIARIEKLEQWKAERERQQVTFPLDKQSIDILHNYFMRLTGGYSFEGGAAAHTFVTYIGSQKLLTGAIGITSSPAEFEISRSTTYRYSVTSVANDEVTIIGTKIVDGARMEIITTGTAPAPLDIATTYWAIQVSDYVFKFTTDGVNPINLTNVGSGIQFLRFF